MSGVRGMSAYGTEEAASAWKSTLEGPDSGKKHPLRQNVKGANKKILIIEMKRTGVFSAIFRLASRRSETTVSASSFLVQ